MGKKVQTDNKSQLGKNTKEERAADNVYLGETNVSVVYLVSFVVFFCNVLVIEIGWTDVRSGGYILVSCAHSNTTCTS
jgi:hypothetical protein